MVIPLMFMAAFPVGAVSSTSMSSGSNLRDSCNNLTVSSCISDMTWLLPMLPGLLRNSLFGGVGVG